MPYIDTKYLFKCETCRNYRNNVCRTFCESGEGYSPNMRKIPTIDVATREEVARRVFEDIETSLEKINRIKTNTCELDISKVDFYFFHKSDFDELKKKYTEDRT